MAHTRHSPAATASVRGAGFTLIEVLVALVVLSTGIVLILRAFETSLATLAQSRDAMWGNLLVREIIAETRLSLRSGEDIRSTTRGQAVSGPCTDFRWERIVEPASGLSGIKANGATNTLSQVAVRVWRDGSSREYSVTTYLVHYN